jgi:DNA-binding Lrp family transcriptional regulator
MTPGELEDRLLSRLQGEGIPLSPVPYADLAEELGIAEEEVLQAMERLIGSGLVRFFGGFFDATALGMQGVLCALAVPEDRVEVVAALVDAHPEVTHDYQREGDYALWFTLNAGSSGELDRVLTEIEEETECTVALRLPSQEVWKLRTDFRLPGSRS